MTEYRKHPKTGVYQARDHCQHCKAVINQWHRCGTTPSLVLCCSSRICHKCGQPSGIKAYHGKVKLVPAVAWLGAKGLP